MLRRLTQILILKLFHCLLLLIKTQPLQQWSVGREFRPRLKKAFDEQGIMIGIPQKIEFNIAKPYSINGNNREFGEQTDRLRRNRN